MRNVLENASKDKENTQDSAVRKLFEEAATKFNKKPKDGIKFLMEVILIVVMYAFIYVFIALF